MAEIVIFGNYTREGFRLETNEPLAQQMLGDGLFRYGIGPAPCKSAKMEIGGVACPWWSQVEHDGVLLFCSNQDTSPVRPADPRHVPKHSSTCWLSELNDHPGVAHHNPLRRADHPGVDIVYADFSILI
jgi:hypothetical protein